MVGKIFSPNTIYKKGDPSIQGKNNPRWTGGRPKCKDCKKLITRGFQRCPRCRGLATRMEKNPHWKGGKYKTSLGYVFVYNPEHPNAISNGYVAEHRLIAGEKLGRALTKYEHVHHINGKKGDNSEKNLEVINGSTHNLITKMESIIKSLEKKNIELEQKLVEALKK